MYSILLSIAVSFSIVHCDIVFIGIIWRHGDRAPSNLPYPLDINIESSWPRGWKQLTNEGILQMYDLGQWIRNRYVIQSTHIKPVFDHKEVYVRSSDSERALTSAQAVMAGLFTPDTTDIWKRGLAWQPTPIHSNGDHRDDPLLKPTSIDCPAYNKVVDQENAHILQSINITNEQLFLSLTKNTGMTIDATNVDDLYDIHREIQHGLPQPSWVTDELVDKIIELKRQRRINEFNSLSKSRYRGGYLVGDLQRRINEASNGTNQFIKTVLYSSHEGTLSSLMYAMGVGNDQLIPYAAAIIIELHKDNDKEYVQLWYRNETTTTTNTPFQLTIPKCTMDCPLSTFNQLMSPIVIKSMEDLTEQCATTTKSSSIICIHTIISILTIYLSFYA